MKNANYCEYHGFTHYDENCIKCIQEQTRFDELLESSLKSHLTIEIKGSHVGVYFKGTMIDYAYNEEVL